MSRIPPTTVMSTDRILIFDTTLRDGEQGPGFSLHVDEKLALARALDALGVDIMEAGFPIASPGDAEAVRRVATEIRRPTIAALARCRRLDVEKAADVAIADIDEEAALAPASPHAFALPASCNTTRTFFFCRSN